MLFVLYVIFVIVMYMSCYSFPIKGTPLGEIDTLSVLRLSGMVYCHCRYYYYYYIITIYVVIQVFAVIKYTYELHFVTYIYIYIYNIYIYKYIYIHGFTLVYY